jgi:hypothetical protein
MKIFLILSICLIYTLTANPYIFNIDNNNELKLSSMFSNMKQFHYNVQDIRNTTTQIPVSKKNTEIQLGFNGYNDFYIPSLEMYDETATPMPYMLTIKPCETCLTFDYIFNNYTSGNAECELNNNEITYKSIKDDATRAALDVKKNLQIWQFDFILTTEGKVMVSSRNGTYDEITKYINDTDFHDESAGIHDIYTYDAVASTNLVVNCDKHIYVFRVVPDVNEDLKIVLNLDPKGKIKKDKLADIKNDDIEQVTSNYVYEKYYIFVRKGDQKGIHTLTLTQDKTDYTVSYVSSVTFGSEPFDLNIVNVYGLHIDNNIAYMLIEGKGLIVYDLDNSETLGMITNQYITKMDNIFTGDYTYLGLFIENKEVDEFFVELAIPLDHPIDWGISRAYLSKNEYKYTSTDSNKEFTYFSTVDTTYLISRNQLIEKMLPTYKVSLALSDYTIFSDNVHYSIVKPKSGPKDEVIAFDFTLDNPFYNCRFVKDGNYRPVITSYERMGVTMSSINTNYNVTISEDTPTPPPTPSSHVWLYLLIGAAILLVIGVIVFCVRKKMRDGNQQVGNRDYNRI